MVRKNSHWKRVAGWAGVALMLVAPGLPAFAQGALSNPAALTEKAPAVYKAPFGAQSR